jgi:large subunit ribosomal protein L29
VIRERELGIRATPAPIEKPAKKATKKTEKTDEAKASEAAEESA